MAFISTDTKTHHCSPCPPEPCCSGCGTHGCDGCCGGFEGDPTQVNGAAPRRLKPVVVIKTKKDFTASINDEQIDNVGTGTIKVRLPQAPLPGLVLEVNAVNGPINVEGGCRDIIGQDPTTGVLTLAIGQSAFFIFSASCVWAVILGQLPGSQGTIWVPNIAALAAIDTTLLKNQTRAHVVTLDADFELLPTSTAAPDGITLVAAKTGTTTTGNWGRLELFSKQWSTQLRTDGNYGFFIDAVNGSDENDGTATTQTAGTNKGPLKSNAEGGRRLHQAGAGLNYRFSNLNDVPLQESTPRPFGTVLISDRWRWSAVYESNPELVDAATGFDVVFDATLEGLPLSQAKVLATGTLGGFTPTSTATNYQNTIDGLGTTLDGFLGQLLVITNSVNPANIGAVSIIGAGNTVDATIPSGSYRMGRFFSLATAAPVVTNPAAGDTFAIVQLTKWGPNLIQEGNSQGRLQVQFLEFPPVGAPPANEQAEIAGRFITYSFNVCRLRRQSGTQGTGWNQALLAANFAACSFDYAGITGDGSGGQVVVVSGTAGNVLGLSSCVFRNAEIRAVNTGDRIVLNSIYMEGAGPGNNGVQVKTFNPTTYVAYGSFLVGAGGAALSEIDIAQQGLAIFNWQAHTVAGISDDAALRLSDRSTAVVQSGASVYGTSSNAGTWGVRVNSGGALYWHTPGATQPAITGVASQQVQLENSPVALQPVEGATPGIQTGSGALVGGTATITAAAITLGSKIEVTAKDPSGGSAPGNSVLNVPSGTRVVGSPGSFQVKSADPAATTTFDYVVANSSPILVPLVTWNDWSTAVTPSINGFGRRVQNLGTGSVIAQVTV
jgi:hypothetical protein